MSTTSALGGVVRRREDPALIQGKARYVDDIKLRGETSAAFVRSPFAHAKVLSIDTSEAEAMDGVIAIFTASDVEHMGPLAAQVAIVPRPLLNGDVVRHVGEAVAMVVATDRYVAQDAVDAIFVEYEPLEAIVDLKDAATDRILVHDSTESNTLISWVGPFGAEPEAQAEVKAGIDAAKERDDVVVVSQEMVNQRLIPTAIEPRRVLADWEAGYQTLTMHTTSQMPHAVAGALAMALGLPSTSVRVIAPEVGGGFGAKLNVYSDEILVGWAARQLERPVRWTETRREAAT
ncbi:Aerobic carbon monoxide dehydrogenase (quinone), large chain, partial [hydrothermal vent metagenome]